MIKNQTNNKKKKQQKNKKTDEAIYIRKSFRNESKDHGISWLLLDDEFAHLVILSSTIIDVNY